MPQVNNLRLYHTQYRSYYSVYRTPVGTAVRSFSRRPPAYNSPFSVFCFLAAPQIDSLLQKRQNDTHEEELQVTPLLISAALLLVPEYD